MWLENINCRIGLYAVIAALPVLSSDLAREHVDWNTAVQIAMAVCITVKAFMSDSKTKENV